MNVLFVAESHDSMISAIDLGRLMSSDGTHYFVLLVDHQILTKKYIEDLHNVGAYLIVIDKSLKFFLNLKWLFWNKQKESFFGCDKIVDGKDDLAARANVRKRSRFSYSIFRFFYKMLVRCLEIFFITIISKKISPDIVAMKYCNSGSHALVWAKLSFFLGHKSVAMTNTHVKSGENLVPKVLSKNIECHVNSLFFRLFIYCFPHWRIIWHNNSLCRLPMINAIVDQFLGLSLSNPWNSLNSPPLDAIFVESLNMELSFDQKYRKDGIVRVVGSFALDRMSEIMQSRVYLRDKLFHEYSINLERPVIVCSLPPAERFPDRSSPEFPSLNSLLNFWLEHLSIFNFWNIIVIPHPRLNISSLKIDYPQVYKFSARAHDIIPLCDCYLAAASTTIRWAKACAVPSINFDCFSTDLDSGSVAPGHFFADNSDQLLRIFTEISDINRLSLLKNEASLVSNDWGLLDGKSGYRVRNIFQSLVS